MAGEKLINLMRQQGRTITQFVELGTVVSVSPFAVKPDLMDGPLSRDFLVIDHGYSQSAIKGDRVAIATISSSKYYVLGKVVE